MIPVWGGLGENRPHLYREKNEAIIQAGIEHSATEPIDSHPQRMRSHLRASSGEKREREKRDNITSLTLTALYKAHKCLLKGSAKDQLPSMPLCSVNQDTAVAGLSLVA